MRFWRRFILFLFTPGTPSRRTGPAVVRPVRIEPEVTRRPGVIRGRCWVIDGDTIVIDKIRIRLAGIDAPELEHPGDRNQNGLWCSCARGRRLPPKSNLNFLTTGWWRSAFCPMDATWRLNWSGVVWRSTGRSFPAVSISTLSPRARGKNCGWRTPDKRGGRCFRAIRRAIACRPGRALEQGLLA